MVVAVAAAVGAVVDLVAGTWPIVTVIAVLAALAGVTIACTRGEAIALARSGARPADPVAHARLHNLVDGLCATSGLPSPRLHVIDDEAPDAFAVGRDPRRAALAVTTGLLERLDRVQLEGVIAHELSHVKSGDTLVATLAVTLVGALRFPSLVDRAMRVVLPTHREALADVAGVAMTRYPPGLASALVALRDDPAVLRSAPASTAHLWIGSSAHPPLDERIDALREL